MTSPTEMLWRAPDAQPVADAQPTPVVTPDNIPAGVNIPESGTNADLSAAIARDAESYAYSRAYDDVVPEYLARQQELQTGRIDNVADLRTELAANNRQSEALDATLAQRTTEYQAQRMNFKAAQAKAQRDIQGEKDTITARNQEINQTLERNAIAVTQRDPGRPRTINRPARTADPRKHADVTCRRCSAYSVCRGAGGRLERKPAGLPRRTGAHDGRPLSGH